MIVAPNWAPLSSPSSKQSGDHQTENRVQIAIRKKDHIAKQGKPPHQSNKLRQGSNAAIAGKTSVKTSNSNVQIPPTRRSELFDREGLGPPRQAR